MPYTGKPSKGCKTCKSRRIKCDEARPTCRNCNRSGRRCPGYVDEFDLMFRDENKAMAKRGQRGGIGTNKSHVKYSTITLTSKRDSKSPTIEHSTIPDADYDQLELVTQVPTTQDARNSCLWNLEPQVPSVITLPPEFETVPFFFRNFVSVPQQADAMRGYLELLIPVYNRASTTSAVHLATVSVSLAACGLYPGRHELLGDAAKMYGKALCKLNQDLRNPELAKSDESVLATLMFSLYESITSTSDMIKGTGSHIDGAVALTKLRGIDQFKDPMSRSIFRAVRTVMITSCVQRSKPIEPFPFPGAEGWLSNDISEENAANRLTLLCIELPNIRSRAKALIEAPYDTALESEALSIFELAQTVDDNLQKWYETLPDSWQHQTIGFVNEAIGDVETATMWPGEQHVYHDTSLSSIVNDYRVCRIFCQRVVLSCIAWLSSNSSIDLTSSYDQAVYILQKMVDDLCACVPFHLSYEMQPTAKELGQDKDAAEAFGGYTLVWPLYVAANAETIPAAQRAWLFGRLELISRKFQLSSAQVLLLAKRHVLSCSPSFP